MSGPKQQQGAVCRYFRQGSCKYGDECKYVHSAPPPGTEPKQYNNSRSQSRSQSELAEPKLEDVIKHDLERRPQWDLSCYGLNISWQHGGNIITGDLSAEELRLEAYSQHILHGNLKGYVETLARMRAERSLLFKRVLDDLELAARVARTPAIPPSQPGQH